MIDSASEVKKYNKPKESKKLFGFVVGLLYFCNR